MSRTQDHWDPYWDVGHNWALVLAAGEGSRLHALTMTTSGVSIPKQFCSLGGGVSLLHDALRRARAVAPSARTCVVVAEQHRRWWQRLQFDIPAHNLIAQPRNRGTVNGILLSLLHIVHRDPQATVLVLPSDHYVRNEDVLASSLRAAMVELERDRDHLILLGLTPEEPDAELGYIVADAADGGRIRAVKDFVEKPSTGAARELVARGGVWNSFIFAADARMLLSAFEDRCGDLVGEMRAITASADPSARDARLAALYERLPELDFSRDILQRCPSALKVITVPPCGWTDLGTPRRVWDTIKKYGGQASSTAHSASGVFAFLDLAAREAHLTAVG